LKERPRVVVIKCNTNIAAWHIWIRYRSRSALGTASPTSATRADARRTRPTSSRQHVAQSCWPETEWQHGGDMHTLQRVRHCTGHRIPISNTRTATGSHASGRQVRAAGKLEGDIGGREGSPPPAPPSARSVAIGRGRRPRPPAASELATRSTRSHSARKSRASSHAQIATLAVTHRSAWHSAASRSKRTRGCTRWRAPSA